MTSQASDEGRLPTVGAALARATGVLATAGVDSPAVDASLLIEHVLGCTRTELLLRRSEALPPALEREIEDLVARRAAREPLQLVVGEAHFYGLPLSVRPGVLVPRPETERLVELVSAALVTAGAYTGTVIDVGTGSGAIALALKTLHPDLDVWATDVSSAALALAAENASRLGLEVRTAHSDLLGAPEVASAATRAVAIVSNPPYLPDADRAALPKEVAAEPASALFGGADGLDVARRLAAQAREAMPSGAVLAMELDPRNVDAMGRELAGREGHDHAGFEVEIADDLTGRRRFLLARRYRGL